jgi:tRNA nucleotidyltransferase (CCA-adding enzyme)
MVRSGEVDALVGERVWQELARGFMATRPVRMIDVLEACGAWQRLFPQHPPARQALSLVSDAKASLPVRAACVFASDQPLVPLTAATHASPPWTLSPLVLPVEVREVIELTHALSHHLPEIQGWTVKQCLSCLLHSDAMRRPTRLREALDALGYLAAAHTQAVQSPLLRAVDRLRHQCHRLLEVDTSAASTQALAQGLRGPAIGEFIRSVQEAALEGT